MTTTGLATHRCYAAQYHDCDGGPPTREHWITQALLKRIRDDGTGLQVTGLDWLDGPVALREGGLASKVLCGRHNEMLHKLDDAAIQLHDAWLAGAEQKETRTTINGHNLESWGIKVIAGFLASGAARVDRLKVKVKPPQPILDVVFGLRKLPPPLGFYFCLHDDFEDGFKIKVNMPPAGHELEGIALGITLQMVTLRMLIWLHSVPPNGDSFIYRPAGIDFGNNNAIDFEWSAGSASAHIPLDLQIHRQSNPHD
ncbi:MAG: hypothetical protein ABIU05_16745 [Nitrospirales bacterium]